METLFNTETREEQQKKLNAKKPFHIDNLATSCNHLEKPIDNFEEYKEHPEFGLMVLDYIIENNSKRCPKKHNGNTAVYKQYKGAKGYDDLVSLNTPRWI